ncbi:intracellular septation protein [Sulfurirhabdus autotrophica]|uniref:Inner membrane-spanning protein YciB n=2 Tax=Sulfurirhabdus autotrophica TaxID=1706046 RepID=A0A4R3Y735_9PROT|nr:intracellular septation protein [Sulfurirhabdus autotrophica]
MDNSSLTRHNFQMKFLFDLFPIILFFVAFKLAGSNPEHAAALAASVGYSVDIKQLPILIATAVAIVATFGQIGWVYFRHRKVDTMLWVSLAIIVVFGGATLLLHDETFIKWKPTVLYWLFAATLTISATLFKKNLIRTMMEKQVSLPEPLWGKLNLSWTLFFAIMGFANLYVAFNFSTDTWVNFKLFGTMGLMLVFVLLQSLMLAKHMEDKEP